MSFIDLHVHSNASDGTLSPRQVVCLAKEAGLSAIALTDHDTTAGVDEALSAGAQTGVRVIPGIEVSSTYEGKEIHILGLFVRPGEAGLEALLKDMRARRDRRNEEMFSRFARDGITFTEEELTCGNPGTAMWPGPCSPGGPDLPWIRYSKNISGTAGATALSRSIFPRRMCSVSFWTTRPLSPWPIPSNTGWETGIRNTSLPGWLPWGCRAWRSITPPTIPWRSKSCPPLPAASGFFPPEALTFTGQISRTSKSAPDGAACGCRFPFWKT